MVLAVLLPYWKENDVEVCKIYMKLIQNKHILFLIWPLSYSYYSRKMFLRSREKRQDYFNFVLLKILATGTVEEMPNGFSQGKAGGLL